MSEFHDPSNVINPEHADHHIISPVTYAIVFGTLLVFTGITVGAAYVDLGFLTPSWPWRSRASRLSSLFCFSCM